MKKLALISAITAAAISTSAHAGLSSNITDIQLYLGYYNIEVPCPAPLVTGLAIGGTITAPTLTGDICLDPVPGSGLLIHLDLNLAGTYAAGSDGTTLNSGTVLIEADAGTGWQYYDTVYAGTTNILCKVQNVGHLGSNPSSPYEVYNVTYGLHPKLGIYPLPGLWHPDNGVATAPDVNPDQPDDGINDALCVTNVLNSPAGLYVKGTITGTP